MLDLSKLDEGAGSCLDYDVRFLSLEEMITPKHENLAVEGDLKKDNTLNDINYSEVKDLCQKLWQESRDLRIAVYYTVASLSKEGLLGLKEGLEVINFLIQDMWGEFYPQLDPDDDNDPTERINILNNISPRNDALNDSLDFNFLFNQIKILDKLPYTYRDCLCYRKLIDDPNFNYTEFYGDINSQEQDEIASKFTICRSNLDLLSHIIQNMNEKMEDNGYIEFESLKRNLQILSDFYQEFYQEDTVKDNVSNQDEDLVSKNEVINSSKKVLALNIASIKAETRKDALLLVQKACEYFNQYEPTSPAPYLLNRALRMAEMNFVDLVAEIDENALSRVKEQFGIKSEENT